jgi:hypothetical protein
VTFPTSRVVSESGTSVPFARPERQVRDSRYYTELRRCEFLNNTRSG